MLKVYVPVSLLGMYLCQLVFHHWWWYWIGVVMVLAYLWDSGRRYAPVNHEHPQQREQQHEPT